jgi:hypothetical protein
VESGEDVAQETEVAEEVVESPAAATEEPSQPASGGGGLHSRLNSGDSESPATSEAAPAPTKPTPAKPTPAKPTSSTSRTPSAGGPLTNRNRMAPRRPGVIPRRPLRNLDDSGKSAGDVAANKGAKKKPGGSNIRLAAMPEVKQPTPGAAATGVCASVYGQIQPASLKPNTNTPHIGCAGPMDQWPAGRLRRRRSQACMFGCMMGAMPTTRGSASRCN